MFEVIDICLEKKFQLPTLMLLYGGIDSVAWLGSAPEVRGVRRRFTAWTDKYLLASKPLQCSSLDLYAARCGILHTLTADSDLSVEGQAKILSYAWGNARPADLQELIDRATPGESVVIHTNELAEGFRLGVAKMFEEAESDRLLRERMETRASRFYVSMPSSLDQWPKQRPRGV